MYDKWRDPNVMSKHFINFVINGQQFDFEAFQTQEEFDLFVKEQEEFIKENE